jgi:nitroreductase
MPFRFLKEFGKKRKVEDAAVEVEIFDIISEVIKSRRSVRKYLDKNVDDETILKILDAARYAPSAGNHQPWEFIVVRDSRTKAELVEASYGQEWMLSAPVFIVACINNRLAGAVYGERGLKLFGIQDVAAAIQNMLLTAESLGLGTCWVGTFSEPMVSAILHCPDYVRPCAIITLGYPAEKPKPPVLQNLDEFVHFERFGQTILERKVEKEKKPYHMKFR